MKKKSLFLAIVLILSFALVACGGGNSPNNANNAGNNGNNAEANNNAEGADEGTGEGGQYTEKVGFVTDEGGVNDQSFNQGVWEGLQKAKDDFGTEVSYVESHQADEYSPNMETLLDDDNAVIVAAGFKLGDAILEKANNNPDVNFAIVDMAYDECPDNLVGILFKQEQPSFLVGYIAGLTTETGKVGFVGGQEGNIIWAFDYGYEAGVQYAAKELGKEIEVVKQYVGNFSDAAKGKSIASTMYNGGCDVVFHAAGGAGDGVIEAAKEADKWVIGVDRDQNDMAPDNVLTSAMKRADVAVYNVVKDLASGKEFPGGSTIVYGLENDGAVDIAPTSDKNVKPEILEKIDGLKEKIINEEIVVPVNEETYKEFAETL
ncbi:MAG: BMP family ABC transporter substrate-binding protein [Tissierellia bacterium]|nr:BMP family ABC transporter substrate-binding protein [Tissierellia bacterium]